jgi:enamine deaminase RidA (YjgF/YER057c/UK114 family)
MELIVRNPITDVYSTNPDWVHGLEVRGAERFLFVSGTMGLDDDGIAGATIEVQLDLVWRNIRTILASADMSVDNIVRLTSYLRDPSYAGANAAARCAALGTRRIPTTAIVVQTLETEWLVEIEIIAAA